MNLNDKVITFLTCKMSISILLLVAVSERSQFHLGQSLNTDKASLKYFYTIYYKYFPVVRSLQINEMI